MPRPPQGGIAAPIDPAIVRSTGGYRTVVRWRAGAVTDISTAWMGPGNIPDVNVVQDGLPTRVWDFPVLWNMRRTPNAGKAQESGGTDFSTLRALADQTHVRLVIETVKNEWCGRTWSYMLEEVPGEALNQRKKRTANDPRIKVIREFFKSPDRLHDWKDWLRLLLEEVLVCDNLSLLFRDFEYGGADRIPYACEVIDGDTIQVMSDLTGRSPDPPAVAYEQWIKGMVFQQFTVLVDRSQANATAILGARPASERIEELFYSPRNIRVKHFYGFSPVEQLLFYVNIIMRRDLTKLAHYTDGNIPAGFLPTNPDWNPKQIADFQLWLDLQLSGNTEERSKVIAVPGSSRAVDWAKDGVLTDRFDDDWVRLVTFAFDVSNASFIQHANKSTSSNAKEQAEEDATSIGDFLAGVQNYIIRKRLGFGDIVAVMDEQLERDAVKRKEIDVAQLAAGIVQLNELRRRNGDDEYPELQGVNGMVIPTVGFVPFPQPNSGEPDVPADPGADPQLRIAASKANVKKNSSVYAAPRSSRSGMRY